MDVEKYIAELRAKGLSDEVIKQELEKLGVWQEYTKVPGNQPLVIERKKVSFFVRALLFSVYLFLLTMVAVLVFNTMGEWGSLTNFHHSFRDTLPSFFKYPLDVLGITAVFSVPYSVIMSVILFSDMDDKRSRRRAYLVVIGFTVVGTIVVMFFNPYVLLGIPTTFLYLIGVVALARLIRETFLFLKRKSAIFATITTVVVLALPFVFFGVLVWNNW